jgi:hypothetical protein
LIFPKTAAKSVLQVVRSQANYRLVAGIHVLTEGLAIQRLRTPELVTEEVIRSAFAALAINSRE